MRIYGLLLVSINVGLVLGDSCTSEEDCQSCDKSKCHASTKRCFDKFYSYVVDEMHSCWCNRGFVNSRSPPGGKINVKFQTCLTAADCKQANSAFKDGYLFCWYSKETRPHFSGWELYRYCSNPAAFIEPDPNIIVSAKLEVQTSWDDPSTTVSSTSATFPPTTTTMPQTYDE